MIENCKLFSNTTQIKWWLDKVKLTDKEEDIINNDIDWIHNFNDSNLIIKNSYDEKSYNLQKKKLFTKLLNSNIDDEKWDLLLQKRATSHIENLFKKYVDDETLVITSSFEHFSVENVRNKCKNVIKLDDETDNSNIIYNVDYCIDIAKKYKNVFVYLIATECITGRRRDNIVYKELNTKLKDNNINFVMVLDAVQEMFLYPRDYSFYHFIIGTVHSTYDKFDQGLLFVNKELVKDYDDSYSYRNTNVLCLLNRGLDVILKRHKYILMYNKIMDESLNKKLFYNFSKYTSQPNFYSIYTSGSFLYYDNIAEYIKNAQEKGKNIHSGASIDVSYHKKYRELVIGFRAQSLMFDDEEIYNRYNSFYNSYKELCKRIMKYDAKGM